MGIEQATTIISVSLKIRGFLFEIYSDVLQKLKNDKNTTKSVRFKIANLTVCKVGCYVSWAKERGVVKYNQ